MTFIQPPTFGDDFFKQQVILVDRELATLKQIMESQVPLLFAIPPILGIRDLH